MKCLLIESLCFHDLADEHDWHHVDVEVAFPGRDRTYASDTFLKEDDVVEEDIEPDHEVSYPSEDGGVNDLAPASTMDDHHEEPLTGEQKR